MSIVVMEQKFDLIIFGATGFAGFYILRELLISIEQDPGQYGLILWAIAGRNPDKMDQTLNDVGKELNKDLSKTNKIIADVSDSNSLLKMARRTKLLINCVGPYTLMGRQVVNACVEAGCHHIDISGEPNYIESIALEFYKSAMDKGLIIISACGWDSLPCDIGVDFTKQNFDGRLHSIESFVRLKSGPSGYKLNFGTLNSAIYATRHQKELNDIRRRLYSEVFPKQLPQSRIVLKKRLLPFSIPQIDGWNVEFPGSDQLVVQRTQHYNYENFNEPPVRIQTYFTLPYFLQLFKVMVFSMMFTILTATNFGSNLIKSYPEFFTFGAFSKNGPNREQIESTNYETTFLGKGWSKKIIDSNTTATNGEQQSDSEPSVETDSIIITKVSGADPGYINTSTCIVQSGLTILLQSDQIPKGVLTPASAFRNTNLLDRLEKRGMKFKVVDLVTKTTTTTTTA